MLWLTEFLPSAIELKTVFQKLQEAEQSGLSAEHVRKLEEQASEQGVRVIWKVGCPRVVSLGRADRPWNRAQNSKSRA